LLSAAGAALCFIATDASGTAACNNVELFFRFPPQTFRQPGHYRLEVAVEDQVPNVCEFSIDLIKDPQAPELDRAMACQRPGIATRLNTRMNEVTIDGIVFHSRPDDVKLTMTGEHDEVVFQALAAFPRASGFPKGGCGDLIYQIEPHVEFLVPGGG
jgi:hypothetical protein